MPREKCEMVPEVLLDSIERNLYRFLPLLTLSVDDLRLVDPLPPVQTTQVVRDPRPVTVLHRGVLFTLHNVVDGRIFACERLAEGLVAPGVWNLDTYQS